MIAVIANAGFKVPSDYKHESTLNPFTPWGEPSCSIKIYSKGPLKIAYLNRHGYGHSINPSEVNFRANLAALKSIGAKIVVSFSSVGSLVDSIKPGEFCVPNQLIDLSNRNLTFFEKGLVGHARMMEPFDSEVQRILFESSPIKATLEGVAITIQGPCTSTKAESHLYKNLYKGSVIGMITATEAKLAREIDLSYGIVCLVTDYDSWKDSDISNGEISRFIRNNTANANVLFEAACEKLHVVAEKKEKRQVIEKVVTDLSTISEKTRSKLQFLQN